MSKTNKDNQAKTEATQAPLKAKYLVNARYNLPPFGGIAMPKGTNFHGFQTMQITESKQGAGISKKQVLAAIRKKLGRKVDGLTIQSVTLLPVNW